MLNRETHQWENEGEAEAEVEVGVEDGVEARRLDYLVSLPYPDFANMLSRYRGSASCVNHLANSFLEKGTARTVTEPAVNVLDR